MKPWYMRTFLKISNNIFINIEKFPPEVKIYEVGYVLIVWKMYSLPALSYNL